MYPGPTTIGESSAEPLRGTIDHLVLRTLSLAPMHGWGITRRIQQVTDGVLEVNQGPLYPALQRLVLTLALGGAALSPPDARVCDAKPLALAVAL